MLSKGKITQIRNTFFVSLGWKNLSKYSKTETLYQRSKFLFEDVCSKITFQIEMKRQTLIFIWLYLKDSDVKRKSDLNLERLFDCHINQYILMTVLFYWLSRQSTLQIYNIWLTCEYFIIQVYLFCSRISILSLIDTQHSCHWQPLER